MIQLHLKGILEAALPDLEWTTDYYTAEDHTGTVYAEAGEKPDLYEYNLRFPHYMVYIRSSDWEYAEYAAQKVFDELNKKHQFDVQIDYKRRGTVVETKRYHVIFMEAEGEPLPLGVKDNIMEYSVNFKTTLREVL